MIGYIKNQIFNAVHSTDKKWWEVVDGVVKDYSEKHGSRSTLMTPNDAGNKENQTQVKTQIESIRKSDNPQPRIDEGTRSGSSSRRSLRRDTCQTGATRSTPFTAYQEDATKPLSLIYRASL